MVEQMLDGDRIAGGSGMSGSKALTRSVSANRPSAANWWSSAAAMTLLIEPIWNSVSSLIGSRASRLAKPKLRTRLKPSGMVRPSVMPGKRETAHDALRQKR